MKEGKLIEFNFRLAKMSECAEVMRLFEFLEKLNEKKAKLKGYSITWKNVKVWFEVKE